jgi:hypothetical protein
MDDVNELTDAIADPLFVGSSDSAANDLEEMFGALTDETAGNEPGGEGLPLETTFPEVPKNPLAPQTNPPGSGNPPPAPEAAMALESHLAMFN